MVRPYLDPERQGARLVSDGSRMRPDTAYHNPTMGPSGPGGLAVLAGASAIAQPRWDGRMAPASINRVEPRQELGALEFAGKTRGGT